MGKPIVGIFKMDQCGVHPKKTHRNKKNQTERRQKGNINKSCLLLPCCPYILFIMAPLAPTTVLVAACIGDVFEIASTPSLAIRYRDPIIWEASPAQYDAREVIEVEAVVDVDTGEEEPSDWGDSSSISFCCWLLLLISLSANSLANTIVSSALSPFLSFLTPVALA